MIRPLSLFIGWRYTRAKKRSNFVSFISLASMLGIALGVTVLITVVSVMNGFDYQVRTRFFDVAPQLTVVTPFTELQNQSWLQLKKKLLKNTDIEQAAPFASGNGMLIVANQIRALQIMGIKPSQEILISNLAKKIVEGKLTSLQPTKFNIMLGQTLANRLDLHVGDKVNLFTPQTSVTLAGVFPVYRQFTISAIFHTKGGFAMDNRVAYINMQDALRLFGPTQTTGGLHVKLKNVFKANQVTQQLTKQLPYEYMVSNWTENFGPFSQALDMEKMVLFMILLLIVAVAAFNLVSSLVMVVTDKQADIAILRTLGASPGMIMRSFIWQGVIIGLIGTTLGVLGGIALALHITAIANWIQATFHVQLISATVYLLNFLPSRLHASDVVLIGSISFAMSLLATIYPAFLAFRTQPAEALRYE